jgi:NADH:ubiquinone oxidoreductase subunit 2 (subunit N)
MFNFESEFFSILFFFCGVLSVIVGIVNAMYQYKIKRFLAFSSITTVGFVLISFSTMTFEGFFSGIYFMFCYVFSVALLFFILLNVRKHNLKELNELFDLSLLNNNPVLSFIVCIIFLSFAGIPPLIGFFGKLFIFFSLFNSFNYFILFLLLFLSVVSSFYYLRVVRFIYFTKVSEYSFFNYINLNYLFFFVFYFNILFILFFDYFGEFIYFVLIKTFM